MPDMKKKTHYDVLGLKKDCTDKQVKDAFLKLSKAHHPDMHLNDPAQKEKFVEIYEAYSILSRPARRVVYDSDLHQMERMANFKSHQGYYSNGGVETDAPRWKDESIWSMRNKTSENFDKNKPYYGIKGIPRVSNLWIAGGAVIVMLIGTLLHFTALKHSTAFTVAQLDTRDERLARHLFVAKQNARRNGNEMQMRLFMEKFEEEDALNLRNGGPKE